MEILREELRIAKVKLRIPEAKQHEINVLRNDLDIANIKVNQLERLVSSLRYKKNK
jgi:hypothetical protein